MKKIKTAFILRKNMEKITYTGTLRKCTVCKTPTLYVSKGRDGKPLCPVCSEKAK